MVITARLSTGDTADVTRIARLQLDGGVAEVTPLGQVKPLRNGTGALRIEIAGKTESFPGKIAFVSPEVDPITSQVRVWAEVENRKLLLRPGLRGSFVIHPEAAQTARRDQP